MALLTESIVRSRARQALSDDRTLRKSTHFRSFSDVLFERILALALSERFDMFISHSFRDAELVLGITCMLQDLGYKPYVDWIQDRELDRNNVTASTAEILRKRMKSSASLFYLTTSNSTQSKWMPWECGYFDGLREKCAILPILSYSASKFIGQEYLGLYPYSTIQQSVAKTNRLYIYKPDNSAYALYETWVSTENAKINWWPA